MASTRRRRCRDATHHSGTIHGRGWQAGSVRTNDLPVRQPLNETGQMCCMSTLTMANARGRLVTLMSSAAHGNVETRQLIFTRLQKTAYAPTWAMLDGNAIGTTTSQERSTQKRFRARRRQGVRTITESTTQSGAPQLRVVSNNEWHLWDVAPTAAMRGGTIDLAASAASCAADSSKVVARERTHSPVNLLQPSNLRDSTSKTA